MKKIALFLTLVVIGFAVHFSLSPVDLNAAPEPAGEANNGANGNNGNNGNANNGNNGNANNGNNGNSENKPKGPGHNE